MFLAPKIWNTLAINILKAPWIKKKERKMQQLFFSYFFHNETFN